ncbi:hypothetical protein [Desulfofustis glycolicus]|uniref:hypothetical protein n=1 Tax=Desulfofustis glycolicus TaxID=51195 RepID=UPI001160E959|nr:hypothetical protein [Desulfofustis glycolicus]MCB2218115.1 hypothetical protein [Desulfobulbaceae bacterium]
MVMEYPVGMGGVSAAGCRAHALYPDGADFVIGSLGNQSQGVPVIVDDPRKFEMLDHVTGEDGNMQYMHITVAKATG